MYIQHYVSTDSEKTWWEFQRGKQQKIECDIKRRAYNILAFWLMRDTRKHQWCIISHADYSKRVSSNRDNWHNELNCASIIIACKITFIGKNVVYHMNGVFGQLIDSLNIWKKKQRMVGVRFCVCVCLISEMSISTQMLQWK